MDVPPPPPPAPPVVLPAIYAPPPPPPPTTVTFTLVTPAGTVNVPEEVNTCMLEKPPLAAFHEPSPLKNVELLGVPVALSFDIGTSPDELRRPER
jgi:hypothetical protein